MLKVAFFQGEDEQGLHAIPLFGPAEREFEKVAAPRLLPEVSRYIGSLKPHKDAQYVLVNAMGAGEYWGSNVNGDFFPEAALIHAPNDWTGNPLLDKVKSENWPYGFPTFYYAHPFAHHRNKDASQAFGEVELAVWNPSMKRVELVARVDEDKCQKYGGTGVWDKLKIGGYPDVSMGCKVPFDTCSICLDWDAYRKAQATFVPGKHKTPGDAVLAVHKESIKRGGHGIRGVSITRKDYCEHALKEMNRIRPDGRKVFVYNDYPKFFDISFVFIGADKTAKTMLKIAGAGQAYWFVGGAELAEKLGCDQDDELLRPAFRVVEESEKTASVPEEALKTAFLGKLGGNKGAEITKDVVPSQFTGKAIPALTSSEPDLPRGVLDALGSSSFEEALSTPSALGIVLRPREFQRVILVRIGHAPLADQLEREGTVFPKTDETEDVTMGPEFLSPLLAKILAPFFSSRSALSPSVERRVLVSEEKPKEKRSCSSSHSSELLRKIGAAYNSYRTGVMNLAAHAQDFASSMPTSVGLFSKVASAPVDALFTPLSASYLKLAYWDEVGSNDVALAGVERGLPSRNTWLKTNGDHLA